MPVIMYDHVKLYKSISIYNTHKFVYRLQNLIPKERYLFLKYDIASQQNNPNTGREGNCPGWKKLQEANLTKQ